MAMSRKKSNTATCMVLANCVSLAIVGMAQAQDAPIDSGEARLDQLEEQLEKQNRIMG